MAQIQNIYNDIIYSDFNLYDSTISTNEKAVLNSILNLLQTDQYERFFNPEAYINWDEIMANISHPALLKYYERVIEEEIILHEPRIKEVVCELIPDEQEQHTVYLKIQLYLKNGEELREFFEIIIGE